jgi:regulatory protein
MAERQVAPDVDPDADPENVARQIVLRKLSAQARTRQELAKALQVKRVPPEVADQVLGRFQEVGLIDDAQFARDWVESRQGRRSLSRSALRRELSAKGVDRDEIEAALEPVTSAEEMTAARQLADKKLRSMTQLAPDVRYRRLAGALARRGFGSGVISSVLDDVLHDA